MAVPLDAPHHDPSAMRNRSFQILLYLIPASYVFSYALFQFAQLIGPVDKGSKYVRSMVE